VEARSHYGAVRCQDAVEEGVTGAGRYAMVWSTGSTSLCTGIAGLALVTTWFATIKGGRFSGSPFIVAVPFPCQGQLSEEQGRGRISILVQRSELCTLQMRPQQPAANFRSGLHSEAGLWGMI
jgi:hypothetical protein